MKKVLLTALMVLLPLSVNAQTPFVENFQKAADRIGIERETQELVIRFGEGLKDDMIVDYSITSVYPPVIDVTFASGREIHAMGDVLQLIDSTDYVIYAEEVCPILIILGAILFWAGFSLVSLPLLIAGVEFLILTYIICS